MAAVTARTSSFVVSPEPHGEAAQVEEFLQSLARTIRLFHTYPPTSSRCIEAVDECHRTLGLVEPDSLTCVVSPHELLVSGSAIGRNTLIEHEVARRLYEYRCQALTIERSATHRDLALFCAELTARQDRNSASLSDRLHNHGLERIKISAGYRPEIIDVDATGARCAVVKQDEQRRDAQPLSGRAAHLYPADKGWVRVDPGAPLRRVTLSGLALLVEDPGALAQMLSRVAGEPNEQPLSPAEALEERCEDIARLYASLEPPIARGRFAKLAASVLALDKPRRQRLLSTTVLPGLIDGRPEGDVVRDFPDVDLADALSLLLEVETAAPELLTTAMDRLHLPPERRTAVAPLLEARIRGHHQGISATTQDHTDAALRARTQQLIRIANGEATFDGFAAFDLCIDDATADLMAQTSAAISATNLTDTQLICLSQLIALNPNPEVAERLLRQVTRLLGELERTKSWTELAARLTALQRSGDALRESRPDVATAIATAIESFYTPPRFARLLEMYEAGGTERSIADLMLTAGGASVTPAILRSLHDGANGKRVLLLVCDHAAMFAPLLATVLDELPVPQRIAAIRALGATGGGCESHLSRQLTNQNESVVREALHALARLGSDEAAESVTRYLLRRGEAAALAAEEALLHFSPTATRQCLRSVLRQRPFVIANPALTLRLLQRTDRFDPSKLSDVLRPLTSLRFRFWNRSLRRVGQRANALLQR